MTHDVFEPPSEEVKRLLKQGDDCFSAESPDFIAAAKFYLQVTAAAPEWGVGYYSLATAYSSQEKWEDARQAALLAAKLIPHDPRPYILLGWVTQKMSRHDDAVTYFEKALEFELPYVEADTRLGLVDSYLALGRQDEAILMLNHIVGMQPMYPSYDYPIDEAKKRLAEYQ